MKSKIFCSYAFTGEDEAQVEARMRRIVDLLESLDYDVYCNLFDEARENYTNPHQFLLRAIEQMKNCDFVLAIQTSSRRSEGMLTEIGAAIARGKPILLAQHESAVGKTYLPQLAKKTKVWQNESELDSAVRELVEGCD